ncbi:MAG: hypothetical protein ACI8PP_001128 [Candidatus Pseudothioglobus sp.]|jgi:hypothetical protein
MNQISYFKLGLTIVLSLLIAAFLTALIGLASLNSIASFAAEQTSKAPSTLSIAPQTAQQPSAGQQAAATPTPTKPSKLSGAVAPPIMRTDTRAIMEPIIAVKPPQKAEITLSASARATNIEICNFWKSDYEKSKTAAAKKFRKEACERANMNY